MYLIVKKIDKNIIFKFCYLILLGILWTLLIPAFPPAQPNNKIVNDQPSFSNVQPKVSDIPPGWSYEKLLNIDPVTPETDYQVKVILTPLNFDYSKAQPDGSDLRFYDMLNNPLSYWIESWNTIGSSIVWVKVPTGGTSSIYMYYGNQFALSESDGDATFLFFDDFLGSSLDTNKWTIDNDQYSSTIVSGGVVTVTTDNPDERNGGALIGFNDFYVKKPPAPFNAVYNNSLNLGGPGRGHRILTRANTTASIMVDNALTAYSWKTRDIRWVSDSLVQYNNGTSIITHTNSTCIPDMPLGVRILTHSTFYGPGDGCSGAIRSINTVGRAGRALRTRSYHAFDYDGLGSPSIQVDWVLVRKTVVQEPAVTIVDQTLNLISPESKTYAGPMSGHYPASYGFEKDNSVPYSYMTLSGQPPTGWTVYYPGQEGKLRVVDEYDGHKKVVELRKSRGTYGKDRVGMTKNFATSATGGTVEFWFNKDSDSGDDATKFRLLGTGGNIEFGIENKALYHGPYTTRINIATDVFPKDTWLHIRVDFNITQGGWQIQLNGTWYGLGYTLLFEGTPTDIYGFDLRSHGTEFDTGNPLHDFYFDALGYSWDPGYNIGDNMNEGLLLDFDSPTKARVDWEGYFPASEGFEGISEGATPENWGHWQGGSLQPATIETKVLDTKTDAYGNVHSKVLYGKDDSVGCIWVGHGRWNDVRASGTYEFWILQQTPGTNYGQSFGLLNANSPYYYTVRLGEDSGTFRYVDGNTSIDSGIAFNENKWYRISVDFSDDGTYAGLPAHHYRARFYDSNGIDLLYTSPDTEFQYHGESSGIHASTGDSVRSNLYFDAFGYSWDPNYDIGDNILQAVYEGSDPAYLTWRGYSLDSSANITIEGDTTIVMPDLGEHNIRLSTSDSYSIPYQSELRSFQVRTLEIITPESKLYIAPMSGYYPATFGFENDENGAFPRHWEDWSGAHPIDTWIVDEFLGHKKVLRGYDGGTGAVHARNYFNNTEGTIELWMAHTSLSASQPMSIQIFATFGDPTLFTVQFQGGEIQVFTNGTVTVVGTYSVNTWHHVRMDFRSNSSSVAYAGLIQNQYTVFINGVDLGTFASNAIGDPYYARLYSLYAGAGYEVYFDAIGYSWDPDYDIDDNLNEGLLLSFNTPTELDWAGYSLDGGTNATILGNASIPMPAIGSHTIQVFGNDSTGAYFRSEFRSFDIGSPDPPSISGVDDFSFNFGEPGWSVSWTASDPNPVNYTVYRNGTSYQEGTWISSIIVPLEGLEQGTHNFTCVVQNDFGLQASDEVWVTVLPAPPDTTPPTNTTITGNVLDNFTIESKGWDDYLTYPQRITDVSPMSPQEVTISLNIANPGIVKNDTYQFRIIIKSEGDKGLTAFSVHEIYVIILAPDYVPPGIVQVGYPRTEVFVFPQSPLTLGPSWKAYDEWNDTYTIYINGTVYESGGWTEGTPVQAPVTGINPLPPGLYNVTIAFSDLSNNIATAQAWVKIVPLDTIAPSIIPLPGKTAFPVNFSQPQSFYWNCTEEYILNFQILVNGTPVNLTWRYNLCMKFNRYNLTNFKFNYTIHPQTLSEGTWNITFILQDMSNNIASDSVFITITGPDSIQPSITEDPISSANLGYGTTFQINATDAFPDKYTLWVGTTLLSSGAWESGVPLVFNVDDIGIMVGDNDLKIDLIDLADNLASYQWTFNFSDIDKPTLLTAPPNLILYEHNYTRLIPPFWSVEDLDSQPGTFTINLDGVTIAQGVWTNANGTLYLPIPYLLPGTHHYDAYFRDASGNTLYSPVDMTLYDITKPSILAVDNIRFEPLYSADWFEFYISELHPAQFSLYRNGTLVDSNPLTAGFPYVFVRMIDLSTGSYNYTMVIEDESGNIGHLSIRVQVTDYTPPLIVRPFDMVISEGAPDQVITWEIREANPQNYSLYRNGFLLESGAITESRLTHSLVGLMIGEYTYTLVVYDTLDLSHTSTSYVTVLDMTPPTLSRISDCRFIKNDPNAHIVWQAYDLHPSTYMFTINGEDVSPVSWDGAEITLHCVGWAEGNYDVLLQVSDTSGNLVSDEIKVEIVLEESSDVEPTRSPGFGLIGVILVLFLSIGISRRKKKPRA